MGLDMFLKEEIYIGAKFEHRKVTGTIDISINGNKKHIPFNKIYSITIDVAYWRKANQIMNWFTRRNDWDDDRQEVTLSGKELMEFVHSCKTVIASLKSSRATNSNGTIVFLDTDTALELLPPLEGFFFGSQNIDEYYLNDLEKTIEQLSEIEEDNYYKFTVSW